MSAIPVEVVWIWSYTAGQFKPAYGRLQGDGPSAQAYSKNYLQVSGACATIAAEVFDFEHRAVDGAVSITWRWPQDSRTGSIRHPNDRFHFRWLNRTPAPFKLAMTVSPEGPESIPGDPSFTTVDEADAELERLAGTGISPFLVAVKLVGETDVLHARAYLGSPPSGLEFTSITQLPDAVQTALHRLNGNTACSVVRVESGGLASPEVKMLLDRLEENPNLLLVGPPGTGKTVLLEQLREYVESGSSEILFDPDKNHDAFSAGGTSIARTTSVVLHPSFAYENMVLGLLPKVQDGTMTVQVTPGPLVNLAHFASDPDRRALLVIDEFNRGNASAVLGDTLALLDKDKRSRPDEGFVGASIDFPYEDGSIQVPEGYASAVGTIVPSRFSLPGSLWIAAAMNSADRSIAPLDAALRRRFSIIDCPPDYDALRRRVGGSTQPLPHHPEAWDVEDVSNLAVAVLSAINERIEFVLGADFKIGQSVFWHVGGQTVEERALALAVAIDVRLVPTLRITFADYDEGLAAVLAVPEAGGAVSDTRIAFWQEPPAELGAIGQRRLRLRQLAQSTHEYVLREARRLAGM